MMRRGPTSAAEAWSRRALSASLLVGATFAAALAASGGAAGTRGATVGTPDTATLVGTVEVADLPRADDCAGQRSAAARPRPGRVRGRQGGGERPACASHGRVILTCRAPPAALAARACLRPLLDS